MSQMQLRKEPSSVPPSSAHLEASDEKAGRSGRAPSELIADCGHESTLRCSCGNPASLEIEDATTVSLSCARGHRRYFFKRDDGTWESKEDRQKRMNKYRICDLCGAEFMDADHSLLPGVVEKKGSLCPACAEPLVRQEMSEWQRRNNMARQNPKSPWRLWLQRSKKHIQPRIG